MEWAFYQSFFFLFLFFYFFGAVFLAKDGVSIDEKTTFSPQRSDASKFIIAHSPNYVTFLPNAGAIPSDEISNVIGLAMGFSSTKVGYCIRGH